MNQRQLWGRLTSFLLFLCLLANCSDSKENTLDTPVITNSASTTSDSPEDSEPTDNPADTRIDGIEEENENDSVFTACTTGEDCDENQICVMTADGSSCAENCEVGCPENWSCEEKEEIFVCKAPVGNPGLPSCYPCRTKEDCPLEDNAACVPYGPAGNFCGASCEDDEECPGGYACQPNPADTENWGLCVFSGGSCACSEEAIEDQAGTTCYAITNDDQTCEGVRVCSEEGLSSCNVGMAEVCDGIDNDCDGVIDNGIEGCIPDSKTDADEDGFSVEEGDCDDSDPDVNPAAKDICDGKNNDCDTSVDEDAGSPPCTISNENGTCTGMTTCIEGEEICEGTGANECGTCDSLPDAYGMNCGCSGIIGCDGTCQGDTSNPCSPTTCFVGNTGVPGQVGCPDICSSCSSAPWRLCFCSAGIGEASLSFTPASLNPGDTVTITYWSPVPMNDLALRINTVKCAGAPEPETCENPDDCGGWAYIWKDVSADYFQLGNNTLDILSDVSEETCDGELQSLEVRGIISMVF